MLERQPLSRMDMEFSKKPQPIEVKKVKTKGLPPIKGTGGSKGGNILIRR